MRQLIAGNWKMNGLLQDATTLASELRAGADGLACDILICPPATLIHRLTGVVGGTALMVGGQDCHTEVSGAYTGDISASMLRDAGASWVLAGHSERRADHRESNEMIQAKARAAVAAGLTPIVCVGETEAERLSGAELAVVEAQLLGSLPRDFAGVVAYEPVWAIGTGRTPTTVDVAVMHAHIRAVLVSHLGMHGQTMRILYGGSVKPSNAAELLAVAEVGGALVGGASLKAADFLAIARAAHDRAAPVAAAAADR